MFDLTTQLRPAEQELHKAHSRLRVAASKCAVSFRPQHHSGPDYRAKMDDPLQDYIR